MQEPVSLSTRLVAVADCGHRMLREICQAPPCKIDIIPHGIPDAGFVDLARTCVFWGESQLIMRTVPHHWDVRSSIYHAEPCRNPMEPSEFTGVARIR